MPYFEDLQIIVQLALALVAQYILNPVENMVCFFFLFYCRIIKYAFSWPASATPWR
jgi:hypothetical protein